MYTIIQQEPEGWLKAFLVMKNGEHVATFSYYNSAVAYIEDRMEWDTK